MVGFFIYLMERGLLPDALTRFGIRRLCRRRLEDLVSASGGDAGRALQAHVETISRGAVAFATKEANEQHYEVPAEFFGLVLGPRRKYSCCEWSGPMDRERLLAAEDKALLTTMDRAELRDGMRILELGCGWGSLTLSMAARFPAAQITAVSNSASQRAFIEGEARRRGLANIEVITTDMGVTTDLGPGRANYDRIVSVEMFEHMRNYGELFRRVRHWLRPEGKVFIHIFTHRSYPYFFETEGEDNWMGRYFFTGGQMPTRDLLPQFRESLRLEKQWEWSGEHYAKTADAWLANMDHEAGQVRRVLKGVYGAESGVWFHRWRVFFLACSELFGYAGGGEWGVTHYLFTTKEGA